MIYIASPYTHDDPAIMDLRADIVSYFAVRMFESGHLVYCPIASWHHLALEYQLDGDFGNWKALNTALLRHAEELWVLELPGWETSVGVAAEIELAERLGIRIRHFEDNEYREVPAKTIVIK